jgi:hypothetical protein
MTSETIYEGALGTVVRVDGAEGTIFYSWDTKDECQGGFATDGEALEALTLAQEVHQSLLDTYSR